MHWRLVLISKLHSLLKNVCQLQQPLFAKCLPNQLNANRQP